MSPINASFDNGILRITLADPSSGNLLSNDMLGSILTAMEQWNRAGVLVLASEGPNFSVGRPRPRTSSGLDGADANRVRHALEMVHALNMKLRNWPGASMAVLRGQARGAAAGFIANCDVVVAETGASLAFPEITYDLPPALVASYLPNRISPRIAQYLLLSGAEIDVNRALAWGIVHEVHSPDNIVNKANALIEFLASRAPGAIDHCKRALQAFQNQAHEAAGPVAIDLVLEWLCRGEAKEQS